MPNLNTPRGFLPVGTLDGSPLSGALRAYRIASGYSTNIFQGDVVKFLTTGFINKSAAGDLSRGIFAGVTWINAQGIPQYSNYWPASTTTLGSQAATALVYDSPYLLMEAQFTNSTANPTVAALGALFDFIDNTGSTQTGLSGEGLDWTTLATSAKAFRVIDFVPRGDNDVASSSSAYARVLCTWAAHDFSVATTVANAVGI